MQVTLSWSELMQAALVGAMRQISNVTKGRTHAHGCPEDQGWQYHIEGACGEYAVAKHFGIFWSGNLGQFEMADVGKLQVRTTDAPHKRLILYKKDNPEDIFVSVVGLAPRYTLRGWVYAFEGKKPEFWKDPKGGRPNYFVSTDILRPMETLKGSPDAGQS